MLKINDIRDNISNHCAADCLLGGMFNCVLTNHEPKVINIMRRIIDKITTKLRLTEKISLNLSCCPLPIANE